MHCCMHMHFCMSCSHALLHAHALLHVLLACIVARTCTGAYLARMHCCMHMHYCMSCWHAHAGVWQDTHAGVSALRYVPQHRSKNVFGGHGQCCPWAACGGNFTAHASFAYNRKSRTPAGVWQHPNSAASPWIIIMEERCWSNTSMPLVYPSILSWPLGWIDVILVLQYCQKVYIHMFPFEVRV
eukprot:jgi/Botrbrau1/17203/Bobra.0817s0001.1